MGVCRTTFAEQLDELGVWWPRGDGDALRATAQAWLDIAAVLDDATAVLDAVVATVADGHTGDAAARLATHWQPWSGTGGHLAVTAADCRRLAASLTDFGTDVDVADRAVALLAEQALAEILAAVSPDACEQWVAWLHDSADGVRTGLDARTERTADSLTDVGTTTTVADTTRPPTVADVDPDKITWVDPGTPIDLSSLGTTPVDFGAGQGVLPIDDTTTPTPDPTPAPDPAPSLPTDPNADPVTVPGVDPSLWRNVGGGTTVVVTGNSGNVTVNVTAAPNPFASPIDSVPPVPTVDPMPDPIPALDGPATAAFGSGSSRWMPSQPVIAPTPTIDAPIVTDARIDRVPIAIDAPGSSTSYVPAAATAATAATAAVAATAAKKNSGFMPFMPMGAGAGGGGDDGNEPRRRARRPRPGATT